jgi:acyl-CoA reductase-like NAD-dependent aldehyde dehydrogenase
VVPRKGVRNVGASTLEAAVSGLRDAVELARWWRARARELERKLRRAAERLREAIAELEAVGSGDPRVRTGLELLYDVERLLEVIEE